MTSTGGPVFSDREMKYMAAACQSFKGDPQLDMEKFSSLAGLTVGSARNAWAAIKKKLHTMNNSDGHVNNREGSVSPVKVAGRKARGGGATAPRTKTSIVKPASKKRNATAMENNNNHDEAELDALGGGYGNEEGGSEEEQVSLPKKKARRAAPAAKPKQFRSMKKPKQRKNVDVDEEDQASGGEVELDEQDDEVRGGKRVKVKTESIDEEADAEADADGMEESGFDEV